MEMKLCDGKLLNQRVREKAKLIAAHKSVLSIKAIELNRYAVGGGAAVVSA